MKNIFKTLALLVIIGAASLFIFAIKMKRMADDVWKQLGLTQTETNWNINNSFDYGWFYYQGAVNASKIAVGDRIGVIRDLAAYAKKYTNSDEFKKKYAEYRLSKKPTNPYIIIKLDADSLRAAERARIQADIKSTEANVNHPNPKVRNGVPYRLDYLKKELAALDDPNNKTIKRKLDDAQRQNDAAMKYYQGLVDKYQAQYPENPQLLIKARLQQMIDIISTVDYNAEISVGKKYAVFVNPEYEKKPKEWKLAYRTGKPATDALKAIAQKWIDEIK